MFATDIFESMHSDVANQTTQNKTIACPKRNTHHNEMNDEIFHTDMNMQDTTRNVMESISFHPFHGQTNSTIYNQSQSHSSISK
jgi:hypothetical protein